jgi:hypothetical protein
LERLGTLLERIFGKGIYMEKVDFMERVGKPVGKPSPLFAELTG